VTECDDVWRAEKRHATACAGGWSSALDWASDIIFTLRNQIKRPRDRPRPLGDVMAIGRLI